MNFQTYLSVRSEWQELFEEQAIKQLLLMEPGDNIAAIMASMDREELQELSKKLRLYEAHRKANQELLWTHHERNELRNYFKARRNSWRKPRSTQGREKIENAENDLLPSPGSLADQLTLKEKLLKKLVWEREYQEKNGVPLPKRWKKSKNNRSNKSCRGSAGLENL